MTPEVQSERVVEAFSSPAPSVWRELGFYVGLGALMLATLGALAAGAGNPAVALAPLLGVVVVYAIWKLPLRYTLYAVTFLVLTLENPAENPAGGTYRSPLYMLGALLMTNWNTVMPIKALRFSGIDLLTLFLFVIIFYRKLKRLDVDRKGQVETAWPLGVAALVSLFTILAMWFWGIARGGDVQQSLWQIRPQLALSFVYFLFHAAMRGPSDHKALGWIIIVAAMVKAFFGAFIYFTVDSKLQYVTHHSDSILYALAFTLVVSHWIEKKGKKPYLFPFLIIAVLMLGMVVNNRRIVWVEIVMVLIMLFMMTPWTPRKRTFTRLILMSLPLIPLYVAVGWNSTSGIFKPAQMFKSVVSSESDSSTAWRDDENANLVWTLKKSPLLGLGFGHEYEEEVPNEDIKTIFPQYRYIPHNSVLGFWAFGGVVGFTGLWLFFTVGAFFAARCYHRTANPEFRTACFSVLAMLLIYVNQAYGDMGVQSWCSVFLCAPGLVLAGKLAVHLGLWPSRVRPLIGAVSTPATASVPKAAPASLTLVGTHGARS